MFSIRKKQTLNSVDVPIPTGLEIYPESNLEPERFVGKRLARNKYETETSKISVPVTKDLRSFKQRLLDLFPAARLSRNRHINEEDNISRSIGGVFAHFTYLKVF